MGDIGSIFAAEKVAFKEMRGFGTFHEWEGDNNQRGEGGKEPLFWSNFGKISGSRGGGMVALLTSLGMLSDSISNYKFYRQDDRKSLETQII